MATQKPTPPARRAIAAPVRKVVPPAPVRGGDDDDVLAGAFDEVEATPARPTTPTKKLAPVAARPRAVAPATKPTGEKIAEEYGTHGMPLERANALGLKGSEAFGSPPKSDDPKTTTALARPKAPLARATARQGTRPRVPAATSTETLDLAFAFRDEIEAAAYLEKTWIAYSELTDEQRAKRNAAFEIVTRGREARRAILRAIEDEEYVINVPPLSSDEEAAQERGLIEEAVGLAASAAEDDSLDDAFETEDEEGGGLPEGVYVMPTGVKVTLEELAGFVLSYARARSFTIQRDMDKKLGTSIGKTPGFRAVKNEGSPEAKQRAALKVAQTILNEMFPPEADDFEVEEDDEPDDGSEPEEGQASADNRQAQFEGEKLALRNRGDALPCARCQVGATGHKGMKGVGILDTNGTCTGWVAPNVTARNTHAELIKDVDEFKLRYADLLGQSGGAGAGPKSAAAETSEQQPAGGVGSGPRRGESSSVPHGQAVGAQERPVAHDNQVSRRGSDVGDGGVTATNRAGLDAGGGAGAAGGSEPTPIQYRDEFETQRRAWAGEVGGPLTDKLTWGINYPHIEGYPDTLPVPHALASDVLSVARRTRMAANVAGFLDKAFFVKDSGELREDIEYGSCSYRVFLAARRLAQTVERFAQARTAEGEAKMKNLVERAARDYVAAHIPVDEEVDDPDFATYAEACEAAGKPIGTPIEEVMGQ